MFPMHSRDGDPRASFLIFDAHETPVRFHRVADDVAAGHRKAAEVRLQVSDSLGRKSIHWLGYSIQAAKNVVRRARPGD